MQKNYSIEEILSAIEDLHSTKVEKTKSIKNKDIIKQNFSEIPRDTLKIIEEAEKVK